ncbi:hypothetical protein [Eubacterium xylanophilum]|uniref:hypothetical protein n=1 Tax=Eubacterium xylanophilum TaxID=39497 RepID=UPI0004AE6FD1|nr:hypothetical protein [Eubacterium xylanophilum]
MACFLVPATEAIVTKVVSKSMEKKENGTANSEVVAKHNSIAKRLNTLTKFLWGGSALLAFEHVWHGEVAPFFPFLTAAENPATLSEMLHEMSTVGVSMAVLITAVWGIMTFVDVKIKKRVTQEVSVSSDIKERE